MVKFTAKEIRDIIISMAVISFVFAYIFAGRDLNSVILLYSYYICGGWIRFRITRTCP